MKQPSRLMVRLLTGLAALTCIATAAFAHHSHAKFDLESTITLQGTVTKYQWTNPHVWLYITVTDAKGVQQEWALEAATKSILGRRGWSSTSMKPGDTVTVKVHPLKTGQPGGGSLVSVTLANGKVLGEPPQ